MKSEKIIESLASELKTFLCALSDCGIVACFSIQFLDIELVDSNLMRTVATTVLMHLSNMKAFIQILNITTVDKGTQVSLCCGAESSTSWPLLMDTSSAVTLALPQEAFIDNSSGRPIELDFSDFNFVNSEDEKSDILSFENDFELSNATEPHFFNQFDSDKSSHSKDLIATMNKNSSLKQKEMRLKNSQVILHYSPQVITCIEKPRRDDDINTILMSLKETGKLMDEDKLDDGSREKTESFPPSLRKSITGMSPYKIGPEDLSKSTWCSHCEMKFPTPASLNIHFKKWHSNVYSCRTCAKDYACEETLKRHIDIDHCEDPLVCRICGLSLCSSGSLKRHLKIHTLIRPLTCEVCNASFTRNDNYKDHMKIHAGEKSHSCHICGKSFARKMYLKSHMQTHNPKESRYTCIICSKDFARNDKLKEHLLRHYQVKKYKCKLCSREYVEKRDLVFHLVSKHKSLH